MAITATEKLSSRQYAKVGAKREATRSFYVTGATTGAQAMLAPELPAQWTAHPEDAALFAVDVRPSPTDGQTELFDVEVRYAQLEFQNPSQGEDSLGFTSFDFRPTKITDDAWRTMPGLTIPAAGTVTNNNTTDIGGVKCDVHGEPLTFFRRQATLVLTEVIKLSQFVPSTLVSYVGARNSSAFFGFATGSVLYIGSPAQGSLGNGKVRLAHEFLADQFFHLRQSPQRDDSGNVALSLFGSLRQAEAVYWRQPYQQTANLSDVGVYF